VALSANPVVAGVWCVLGQARGKESEKGAPPSPEAFAAMDQFTEELVKAGVFVAAAGLKNKRSGQAHRLLAMGRSRQTQTVT